MRYACVQGALENASTELHEITSIRKLIRDTMLLNMAKIDSAEAYRRDR